jgi:CubicO group peptidase (beta-lactamase class C family)
VLLPGLVLAIVLAVAAGWGFARLRRLAVIGAGYKAKVLCSIVFGTGRSVDPLTLEEVSADSYWPLRLFSAHVDRHAQVVTASLWKFRPRKAAYLDGVGATLDYGSHRQPAVRHSVLDTGGKDDSSVYSWPVTRGSAALERLVASTFLEPDATRLRRTRAILVAHDGRIVAEQYAHGFGEGTRFPGWSMTKSVFNGLIGVLVADGRLSLDDRALMPEWDGQDPRAAITLADLLRMRSGLAFSEVYEDLTSDVIEMLFNRADAAAFAASRRTQALSGSTWSYASGTTNILSAIARRVVGEADYPSWPRKALFGPVGMTSALIERDASGTFVGSSFMLATARDWARLGQLYLQDGVWQGRRLLPAGWVDFSTRPTPQSPGLIYGAHWWLGLKPELGGGSAAAARIPRDAFFAVGHEGQVLTVIPSRRLVIVRLGLSIYIDAWNHASFLSQLLEVV